MSTKRAELIAGIKAELPIIMGTMPFGLIFGVLAVEAGLNPFEAQSMSSIIFAGSAQFIAVGLFADHVPAFIMVLTTFVVNLRHALYATSVGPYLKKLPARWKWLLAYLLTDEAYVVTILHYQKTEENGFRHWFYLGAGLTLWLSWQLSTGVGIFLGAQVPAFLSLDFTLALSFIGIIVPNLKTKPEFGAAISAGVVAVAANGLPYKLGLMLAAVAGISAGMWLQRRQNIVTSIS
jgi:4-azaleucine resistance transporter AzlC